MAQVRLGRFEAEREGLPMVCMRCGAPATTRKRKNFAWHPQWVWILLLAGLLPLIIVAVILTKRMNVHAPFCEQHKNHWLKRTCATLVGLVVLGAVGLGGMWLLSELQMSNDFLGVFCVGWLVLALVWLIGAAIIGQTTIRATELTDNSITLASVSDGFVAALKQHRFAEIPEVLPGSLPPDDAITGRPPARQ